jgi:VWFA-related protein
MYAPAAKRLRTIALIFLGCLVVCAVGAHWTVARAQSAQPQTPPAGQSASVPAATPAPGSESPAPATAAAAAAPANSESAEMTSQEAPVPLRVIVNLVPLRVIVRDAKGNAIKTLHKDDFQLFQDGKPQIISNFYVVEPPAAPSPASTTGSGSSATPSGAAAPSGFVPPSRFVALLFDDAHLNIQDAMQARLAATKYVDASLGATDRAAVFTMSGQFQTDFTSDRDKIHKALAGIMPRAVTAAAEVTDQDCPPMDPIEADAIQNHNDDQALGIATTDALTCSTTVTSNQAISGPTAGQIQQAQALVQAMSMRVEQQTEQETEAVFRRLREIMNRMAILPGQRNIVLISPGFIYQNREVEYSELIDSAIRQNTFINTLDARGLYVPDLGGDISQRTNDPNPAYAGNRTAWRIEGQQRQTQTLISFAADTGGWAFHDNNDLGQGLREVASAPDAYYFLAYVPSALKFDGRFHSIKVSLAGKQKYSIQARRGYYAPRHGETPEEAAKRDIEDAVFSQEERHALPIGLQTQYYKTDATDAKLAVLAHVDLTRVHFEKTAGRNVDDLTVVAAIFDRDGNFVTGTQRVLSMKLRDETFQKLTHSGITVRNSFDLKPGDYVVRLVVRDSNAAVLSAQNGVVEIPY